MIDDDQIAQITGEAPSTIHHTLRASRRRFIITFLAHKGITNESAPTDDALQVLTLLNSDIEISARELAREIVSIEENIEKTRATGDNYHNAYTALTQTHLPLLHEIGAIEYNPRQKTITPGHNLIALAIINSQTTTITQMVFHDSLAQYYTAGRSRTVDAIDD